MLNIMRDTLKYSKWILLLVVLSFMLFFGPGDWTSCRQERDGGVDAGWIARVDGQNIDIGEWQARAQNLDEQYRRMFGGNYEQIRKNLNIARRAADDLVAKQLVLRDAKRLGLTVSDEELAATITALPQLQQNGVFIGAAAYRQAVQRGTFPPFRNAEQLEAAVREDLLAAKWRSIVGASVIVSREEIEQEFRRRHEKATFDYLALPVAGSAQETPTDAELESWYRANLAKFPKGEGRRVLYLIFDEALIADRVVVSDKEIEDYYSANQSQFAAPEQRRARHVLVKVAPDAPPEVIEAARAKAQGIAAQARGGAEFAQLATAHSEDEGSKAQGGDLGLVPRGRFVPEFDEVVFTQKAGVVSDPVRSPYGFHVIKVEEIVAAGQQPLAAVKEQIRGQLRFPRVREEGEKLARELRAKAKDAASFKRAAEEMKLPVREAGIVLRSEPVPGLGPVPQLLDAAFELANGGITDVIELPRGPALAAVTEIVPNFEPPLSARRERVLAEYRQSRSREQTKAALAAALAKAGGDLEKAAKELKLEVKKTEPAFTRGTFLPGVGSDAAIDQAAFSGPMFVVSAPIATAQAAVALRVSGREQPNTGGLSQEEPAIREALREPLAQQLVQQRLEALQKAVKIEYNAALLERAG